MLDGPPAFDAAALIADLRKGDGDALDRAYRATFDNTLGRLVLGHFLMECGVGKPFDLHATDGQLRTAVGAHNAALELAARATFDPAALAVAVITGNLEGQTDGPAFNYPPTTVVDDDDFD